MASLTQREREVLAWIWNPSKPSFCEIARYMNISTRTVEKHVERLYKKTGVHSRKLLEKFRANEMIDENLKNKNL
ncbi:MAG: helix-turn-helix transcriptional regulator [Blastochloris sp.]|nr:helix-turn-helix transcriptional regulator [Blastochloris sp.]